jgi:hypothetical protein
MNKQIVSAIKKKLVLRFVYNGKERVVEPQTYGVSKTGKEVLRARQIGGGSRSGQSRIAKLFDVEKLSGLKNTDEQFAEALPEHNPNDSAMAEVFATLPISKRK